MCGLCDNVVTMYCVSVRWTWVVRLTACVVTKALSLCVVCVTMLWCVLCQCALDVEGPADSVCGDQSIGIVCGLCDNVVVCTVSVCVGRGGSG